MKMLSKREKTETQFLTITGILITLIGAPAFISVMKEPNIQKIPMPIAAQEGFVKSDRGPASIVQKVQDNKEEIVKYSCENEVTNKEVDSNSIRIVGVPCEDVESLEINNKSNGYSASIIYTKGNEFTTDFIDLKSGENKIEIISELDDGSKVTRNLKINRRQPASEKQN